jgi:hypothetical protein
MSTPGRTVSGWWDFHNNAFHLERLVRGSAVQEPAETRPNRNAGPAIGLLWRPISFPKSASAKARAARADAIPRPREGARDPRSSRIARTIRGRRDPG